MATDRELATILNSGEITTSYLGGTASANKVQTAADVEIKAAAAVATETELTGIVSIDDIVSINVDIKKIDVEAFDYFIQGIKYSYAGQSAVSPTIGAGDSSTWVGIDSTNVLIYSEDKFTDEETKTIIPLARLQAVQGQSGSGSDLQEPLHLTFAIGQEGYNERQWIERAIGVLYASGGTYSESSTPLQVDQDDGVFYSAQRRRMTITADTNIEASSVYSVSGSPTVQTRATLVIPKYYDDGTDIAALPANKYVSHTLLRSPKEEDLYFLIYGSTVYDSQAQAEEARAEYNIFQSQAASGLYTVARFVVKGDSTNIEAIQDERPSHILEDASTGAGIRPAAYACEYLSSSAETTITTSGVFVKVAGTTTEVTTSADFTAAGNNRFLYTGAEARRFKVEVVCSMTSIGNNQTVRGRFAINGTTVEPSEQEVVGVGTRVGSMSLTCIPELDENDYIEFWIANVGATSNFTVDYMNFNLVSVD